MDLLLPLIGNYGLGVVFVTVLLDQGGLPVPRELQRRGFRHVRPLAGGFDAWRAHGLPVENA